MHVSMWGGVGGNPLHWQKTSLEDPDEGLGMVGRRVVLSGSVGPVLAPALGAKVEPQGAKKKVPGGSSGQEEQKPDKKAEEEANLALIQKYFKIFIQP